MVLGRDVGLMEVAILSLCALVGKFWGHRETECEVVGG